VPWLRNLASRSPHNELLDILVIVPGILEDHAILESSSQLKQVLYQEILEKTQRQLRLLFDWRWDWQARSGHEISSGAGYASPQTGRSGPIGCLHFSRFVVASELMLYNATLMCLVALLFILDPLHATDHMETCAEAAMTRHGHGAEHTSFLPLQRPDATVTLRDTALEICRAFEWVTRNHDYNMEPTFLYLFPVGVAMTALQEEPNSIAWVKSLLNSSPITASYALGNNQARFGFYLSRETFARPGMLQVVDQLFSLQDMQRLNNLSI
jgi:hypothetical protein